MNSKAVVHCIDRQSVTPNLFSDPDVAGNTGSKLNVNNKKLTIRSKQREDTCKTRSSKAVGCECTSRKFGVGVN
jgi:hypothetical protein